MSRRPSGLLRRLRNALPGRRELAAAIPHPSRTWALRLWWLMVIGWVIYTGPVAFADDAIEVTGPGGLFFLPDLSGDGERLFYEKFFGFGHYNIYTEANWNDPLLSALNALANLLMYALVIFGATIAAVTGWLFSMTSIDGMATAIGNVMGASAEGTLGWLFPTALVLGGIIAYGTRNKGGEGMVGNLLWLVVAGTALILTSTHATTLVNNVENVRTVGADTVATMASGATVNGESPIAYEPPADEELEGSAANTAVRKNMDAMWRTLIVTPWCLAEVGSIEACEQYGADILTAGGDDREQAINDVKTAQKDSSTSTWLEGKNTGYAVARVVILLFGLLVGAAFTLFVLFAALTATYALVMSYLLMIVGPLFLALGCIPGMPRQWLMNWGRAVIVQLLMSVIAFMLFSAALSLIAIMFAATAEMGWMLSALLTMTAVFAAVALRGQLERIFNVGGEGGSGVGKKLLALKAMSMLRPRGGGRSGTPRVPRQQRSSAPPEPPSDSGGPAERSGPPSAPPGRSLSAPRQPRALPSSRPGQHVTAPRDERAPQARGQLRATPGRADRSVRTTPAADVSTRREPTAISGTVLPPQRPQQPQTGAASPRPTQVANGYRPRRTQARVRFTRPDLPDAPRMHAARAPQRSEYMSTARTAERAPRSRPVPRQHSQARRSSSDRPRFRAPNYQ